MIETAGAKPDPTCHDGEQGIQPGDDYWCTLELPQKPEALDNQKTTMLRAPDQERPVLPVPKPARRKDEPEIPLGLAVRATAAAERYIKVVAQPLGQTDMPT